MLQTPTTRTLPLSSCCQVAFGCSEAAIREHSGQPRLEVALPHLEGPGSEEILAPVGESTLAPGWSVFAHGDRVAGLTVAPPDLDLESAARRLYEQLFAATHDLHLYRIWNYVPAINAEERGLENYRRFCRGRSLAFEARFGARFHRALPAASAVGAVRGPLALAFLAGRNAAEHFENPRQVPAFEYPPAYGPRPPSFSRATRVATAAGQTIFISGTAAIRGHATVAPDRLVEQLACTRENLLGIAETAGSGPEFGARAGWRRTFKVYLRHATDLATTRADLERHLLRSDDQVTYLAADLCRSDLRVEIEAVLTKA